ncbi:MAG: IPT/TIG domain-containing protein, partial [Melioribacteraceae bacterium]|nr:IPT/TIG domain-containing protein [Melioribacteraceae bacterium]
ITSINPEDGLAGITEFTITGENFSTVLEENVVYFGSTPAIILSATQTLLEVIPPNVVQDSIAVYMNTTAAKFSDSVMVNLKSAAIEVYSFADFEQPYAITADKVGNIYLSFVSHNTGQGIKKLTPQGELLDFAPKGGETFYSGLQYGTEGKLYGARGGARAIFVIEENTAPATYAVFENGTSMIDLDFDKNHNIWVAGKGGKIYRVPSNRTGTSDWKSFEFEPDVSAIKIYNDHLYLAATIDNSTDIYRIQIISADSLSAAEVYFQFSANFDPSIVANSITFSADGQLFIVTDDLDPIKFVNPNGSFGTWYEGVLSPEMISFTWGMENELFVTRASYSGGGIETTQTILTVNMEKGGAPQYGRE